MSLSTLDKKGIALVFAMISLFIAGGVGFSLSKPPERDPETLCIDDLPPEHTILVVDKTDPWSGAETGRLRSLILSIRDDIEKDAKLSIFVFNGSFELGMEPVFSLCSPGRGEETNWLWGNPRRVHKQFGEMFGQPLTALLDELTTPSRGDVSPILEIIADLVNREEMSPKVAERRLLFVSDMVQNTATLSFYRRSPTLDDALRYMSEKRFAALKGMEVQVHAVRRHHSQSFINAVEIFWQAFFAGSGSRFEPLWL